MCRTAPQPESVPQIRVYWLQLTVTHLNSYLQKKAVFFLSRKFKSRKLQFREWSLDEKNPPCGRYVLCHGIWAIESDFNPAMFVYRN